MAWRVVWSDTGAARLWEIEEWLYERSPAASAQFVDRIERDVGRLADHPALGPLWQRHPSLGVRRLVTGKYLVFYQLIHEREEVLVLTLRHARQPVLSRGSHTDPPQGHPGGSTFLMKSVHCKTSRTNPAQLPLATLLGAPRRIHLGGYRLRWVERCCPRSRSHGAVDS